MLYTVYKTTNHLSNKEYVGFHGIKSIDDILYQRSETGSVFKDGYMGSGKLMRWALEKYGPLNMSQELLLVTNDKKEAEELEEEIVCREWVESDSNYNLSLGGEVTILFGERNGFYGRKHTKESIEKIQESRNRTLKDSPWTWSITIVTKTGEKLFNRSEILDYFFPDVIFDNSAERLFAINELIYDGHIKYNSEILQESALKMYHKRKQFHDSWKDINIKQR